MNPQLTSQASLVLIYRPRKDEGLSEPMTYPTRIRTGVDGIAARCPDHYTVTPTTPSHRLNINSPGPSYSSVGKFEYGEFLDGNV